MFKRGYWVLVLLAALCLLIACAAAEEPTTEYYFVREEDYYWSATPLALRAGDEAGVEFTFLRQDEEDGEYGYHAAFLQAGEYALVSEADPAEVLYSLVVLEAEPIPEELVGHWVISTTNRRAASFFDKWQVYFRTDGTGFYQQYEEGWKNSPNEITFHYGSGIVKVEKLLVPLMAFEEGALRFLNLVDTSIWSDEESIATEYFQFKKQRATLIQKLSLGKDVTVRAGEQLELQVAMTPKEPTDNFVGFSIQGAGELLENRPYQNTLYLIFDAPGEYTVQAFAKDGSGVVSEPITVTVEEAQGIPDFLLGTTWVYDDGFQHNEYTFETPTCGSFYEHFEGYDEDDRRGIITLNYSETDGFLTLCQIYPESWNEPAYAIRWRYAVYQEPEQTLLYWRDAEYFLEQK